MPLITVQASGYIRCYYRPIFHVYEHKTTRDKAGEAEALAKVGHKATITSLAVPLLLPLPTLWHYLYVNLYIVQARISWQSDSFRLVKDIDFTPPNHLLNSCKIFLIYFFMWKKHF